MKLPTNSCLTTALLLFITVSSSISQHTAGHHVESRHRKRQAAPVQGLVIDSPQDSQPEATLVQSAAPAPLAALQAQTKFFQYAHVPKKDHYEVGHRQGNGHHFTERHEKANPHAGEFKTKVRWGDKNGGYGEHYWDYNHAGHGDDSHDSHDEPSDNVHEYEEYDNDNNRNKRDSQRHELALEEERRTDSQNKKQAENTRNSHQGAFYTEDEAQTRKEVLKRETPKKQPELYLDELTGHIVDKATGQMFTLQPVE